MQNRKLFEIILHGGRVTSFQSSVPKNHVMVKPSQVNVLFLTTLPTLKTMNTLALLPANYLSFAAEWKDQLKELVADCISNAKVHLKSSECKVLDQPDVKDTLHKLYDNYVLVPADKTANNLIIVCKK